MPVPASASAFRSDHGAALALLVIGIVTELWGLLGIGTSAPPFLRAHRLIIE